MYVAHSVSQIDAKCCILSRGQRDSHLGCWLTLIHERSHSFWQLTHRRCVRGRSRSVATDCLWRAVKCWLGNHCPLNLVRLLVLWRLAHELVLHHIASLGSCLSRTHRDHKNAKHTTPAERDQEHRLPEDIHSMIAAALVVLVVATGALSFSSAVRHEVRCATDH